MTLAARRAGMAYAFLGIPLVFFLGVRRRPQSVKLIAIM